MSNTGSSQAANGCPTDAAPGPHWHPWRSPLSQPVTACHSLTAGFACVGQGSKPRPVPIEIPLIINTPHQTTPNSITLMHMCTRAEIHVQLCVNGLSLACPVTVWAASGHLPGSGASLLELRVRRAWMVAPVSPLHSALTLPALKPQLLLPLQRPLLHRPLLPPPLRRPALTAVMTAHRTRRAL